jgi:hypothetical protein
MYGRLISAAADGAFGRDDGDVLRCRRGDRRLRARFNHTDDRKQGVMRAQGIERGCRHRVAGNHETANMPPDQRGGAL